MPRENRLRSANKKVPIPESVNPRFDTSVIDHGSPLEEEKVDAAEVDTTNETSQTKEVEEKNSTKQQESKTKEIESTPTAKQQEKTEKPKKKKKNFVQKCVTCSPQAAKLLEATSMLHKEVFQGDIVTRAVTEYIEKNYPDVLPKAKIFFEEEFKDYGSDD